MAMRERRKTTYWAAFIAIAVIIHLVLLLTVKQSFFSLFKKSIKAERSGPIQGFPEADAIVTIPIEIEDDVLEPAHPEPTEQSEPEETIVHDLSGDLSSLIADLEDLAGEEQESMTRVPGPRPAVIPPRPVEITWPDTRKLGHCTGKHVIIRIQVDENGEILKVQPDQQDLPGDCIDAALHAARKIVFEPGSINGIAMKMWTRVRIEFRKESKSP